MSKKIYIKIKRILDFFMALVLIILLSPILLIVSISIKIDSKGPVIFKQKRIGKDGKEFEQEYILKKETLE